MNPSKANSPATAPAVVVTGGNRGIGYAVVPRPAAGPGYRIPAEEAHDDRPDL